MLEVGSHRAGVEVDIAQALVAPQPNELLGQGRAAAQLDRLRRGLPGRVSQQVIVAEVTPAWKTGWLRPRPAGSPLRWPLSSPDHAPGRPELRTASANQRLGPHCPAVQALFST